MGHIALPSLSDRGRPYRLQAPRESHRLALVWPSASRGCWEWLQAPTRCTACGWPCWSSSLTRLAVGSLAEFLPPTAILLGTFLILLFPDGRLPLSRWRPVAWLCGTVIATNIVAGVLLPGPLSELRNVRNPFGLEGQPWLADANEAIGLQFPLCLLGSASSLIVRHIRAGKRCASRSSGWPSRPRLSPSGPRER